MPLVALPPGESLALHPGDKDEVQNPAQEEGAYTIAYKTHALVVKHILKPMQHAGIVVPEGGATIKNEGRVELAVVTPGL